MVCTSLENKWLIIQRIFLIIILYTNRNCLKLKFMWNNCKGKLIVKIMGYLFEKKVPVGPEY